MGSLQQIAQFPADLSHDPVFRLIDGRNAHPEFPGNVGRGLLFDNHPPKCLPSPRFDPRSDSLPLKDMKNVRRQLTHFSEPGRPVSGDDLAKAGEAA